ncbi:sulfotransferase [Alteromonas macleodii]|uniref:sulfotransferase family protein n=1 Tax=Alteromonas macleodii TaxID=28108 RepID=UPI0030CB88D9
METVKKEVNSPIFLVGTQRSGTTLLTRILSAHKDIFIQNELPLQTIFLENASREEIVENIDKHFQFRYNENIDSFLENNSKIAWGLKDPQLTEHLDALEQFIPDSKFIIIVRDGRGVVNSYIENRWGLGTNAFTGALRWNKEVELQVKFAEKHPKSCLIVRFEDLIEDQEKQLKNICDHLGIAFDKGMLSYHKEKMSYVPNKQNINTNKAPNKALATQWQNKLSKKEIGIINNYAANMLNKFGYIQTQNGQELSQLSKFYYKLHQTIIGEFQIQYQLKVSKLKKLFR